VGDSKGFDPVEAIIILIGVLLVGGCVALGVFISMASKTHGGLLG